MIARALLLTSSLICPFVGAVFILYSLRGNETLTTFEGVGCFLLAIPFCVITAICLERPS